MPPSEGIRRVRPRNRSRMRPDSSARRWCIPSAIVRSPGETLNGISILDEFNDSVGLLLWLTLDDVSLWASAPAHVRGTLGGLCSAERLAVVSDGGPPTELRYRLDVLSALLAAPGDAEARLLGRACLAIASWAACQGRMRTALVYAQAGALAAPTLASACLRTARYALAVQEPQRAETWLRRGIAVARRTDDWATYARSYVVLGEMQVRQDRLAEADGSLRIAYRTAVRKSIPIVRRDAAVWLLRVTMRQAGATADRQKREALVREADDLAVAAYRAHRPEQPRSGAVLMSLAQHWMERGHAKRALGALTRLRSIRGEIGLENALTADAMMARAAAGCGRASDSVTAEARALEMVTDPAISERVAFAAALDLAHAAAFRRDSAGLDRAAQAALRFAPTDRYESTARQMATLAASVTAGDRKARA